MFKELMPVIADRPLTITVAALADGKIRVCVVPQSQDRDGKINDKVGYQKEVTKIPDASIKALTTPLALTGTAEELDAELAEKLTSYAGAHAQLQHGISQATEEIAEALKAIEERNKTKSKPKSKIDPPAQKDAKDEKQQRKKESAEPAATLPLHWLAPVTTPQPTLTAVSANDTPPDADEQELEQEDSN